MEDTACILLRVVVVVHTLHPLHRELHVVLPYCSTLPAAHLIAVHVVTSTSSSRYILYRGYSLILLLHGVVVCTLHPLQRALHTVLRYCTTPYACTPLHAHHYCCTPPRRGAQQTSPHLTSPHLRAPQVVNAFAVSLCTLHHLTCCTPTQRGCSTFSSSRRGMQEYLPVRTHTTAQQTSPDLLTSEHRR